MFNQSSNYCTGISSLLGSLYASKSKAGLFNIQFENKRILKMKINHEDPAMYDCDVWYILRACLQASSACVYHDRYGITRLKRLRGRGKSDSDQ